MSNRSWFEDLIVRTQRWIAPRLPKGILYFAVWHITNTIRQAYNVNPPADELTGWWTRYCNEQKASE